MIPTFLGFRVTKGKIKDASLKIKTKWLVSAIYTFEDATNILEIAILEQQKRIGQRDDVLIQANLHMEKDSIKLPNGMTFHVTIEGRQPCCYNLW